MSNANPVTRQQRKKDNTHKSIMHNAKMLYEQKGLNNVTIEDITEATDISRSTFFTHFASTDALIVEIAETAIKDIIDAHKKSGKRGLDGIRVIISKLIQDTCPYPRLSAQILMRGILKTDENSRFIALQQLITSELAREGLGEHTFTYSEQTAAILGAYFGIVYSKLITQEDFEQPDLIQQSINKIINKIIGE